MKEFTVRTSVYFGSDAIKRLDEIKDKNVLIVCDNFIASSEILEKVKYHLRGCNIDVFKDIVPDPPVEIVAKGLSFMDKCGSNIIVALGGGSVIDAAKAMKEMADRMDSVGTKIEECFAIPTTSGTGSEVTKFSVITDAESQQKRLLVDKSLTPMVAILDPEFTISVPSGITADTGMDALTHAIEAYVSKDANDFTDAIAEKSITLVNAFLYKAYRNGDNRLAREKMLNASCLAGMAFNDASLGINHSIAHAVGGRFHIPHGKSNAMILPHVIRYNASLEGVSYDEYSLAAKKYQRIARIMGLPASSVTIGVNSLVSRIEQMQHEMEIPSRLTDMGIAAEDVLAKLDDMSEAALADPCTTTNPRTPSKTDIQRIIRGLI